MEIWEFCSTAICIVFYWFYSRDFQPHTTLLILYISGLSCWLDLLECPLNSFKHFKYVHALARYCVLSCRCGSYFWLCNKEPRFLKQQHIKWNVVCHDFQATSFKLLFITILQIRSNHLIVCSCINCTFIVVSGCLVGDLHRITE